MATCAVDGAETLTVNVRLHGGVDEKRLQSVCLTHRLHVPWIPTVHWKRLQTRQRLMSRTCWQISQQRSCQVIGFNVAQHNKDDIIATQSADTRAQGNIGHCARFTLISAHYWQLFKSYNHRRGAACVSHIRWRCDCRSSGHALSTVSLLADRTPRHWFRRRLFFL